MCGSTSGGGGGVIEGRDLMWQKAVWREERSKKAGRAIGEGHRDFELMRNLQLGIRSFFSLSSSFP